MQSVKKTLVKVSGDLTQNEKFIKFVEKKSETSYVVVICGAGQKINEAFEKMGFEVTFDNLHGRITKNDEERDVALQVLEEEKEKLQKIFNSERVLVVSPVIRLGKVLCHINGDNYVKAAYLGFDESYVFTLARRVEKKKHIFKDYPRIKIITIY